MEDETKTIEANTNTVEATSRSDGYDEKPDINDVPMDENQVSACMFSCLLLFVFHSVSKFLMDFPFKSYDLYRQVPEYLVFLNGDIFLKSD